MLGRFFKKKAEELSDQDEYAVAVVKNGAVVVGCSSNNISHAGTSLRLWLQYAHE
jgi:hypothetical protein